MAYFRPHPGTKRRPFFNWAHFLVGNLAIATALAAIVTSHYVPLAGLSNDAILIVVLTDIFLCELLRSIMFALKWKHEEEIASSHEHEVRTKHSSGDEPDQIARSLCMALKVVFNIATSTFLIYFIAMKNNGK